MHTDAYICKQMQMRTDAYRCVQTCTPRNLPCHLSSDSFGSVVSSASRVRLSQNYCPPAVVCKYSCRCMPPHTGMLTSSSPSSSSLSLSAGTKGLGGLYSCCRCITVTISPAASIQMHTNAYTCIHMLTPSPFSCCFFLSLARCTEIEGLGGLPGSCGCNVAITISTATSISIAARSIATVTTISIAQAQQAARARQMTHCINCPACASLNTHTRQHVECDRHAYKILPLLAAVQSGLAWPETAPP